MSSDRPLNLFQRLLRQWDRAHPYNAAQLMIVRRRIEPQEAIDAFNQAMRSLQLGRVVVEGRRFHYAPADAAITTLADEAHLSQHLSAALNQPFSDPAEPPFRPFVVPGDRTSLGVVYQHWHADSVAVRMLMREWFMRLFDPASARTAPPRPAQNGYWNLFGPHHSNWDFLGGLIAAFRRYFRYRRCRKVASIGRESAGSFVRLHDDDKLIARIVAYARAKQVKVHDVFVAAAVEVCRQWVPQQHRPGRTHIAVGSIVDMRKLSSINLADTFGIYLGFDSVVCKPRQMGDWDALLHAVATQHALQKRVGMTQSSLIWMTVAAGLGWITKPKKLNSFYRKETPLLAGVSNVNLNGSWVKQHHPQTLLAYYRISPTGPMTPVVFTTSTLGSTLQTCITYREGLIDQERAKHIAQAFFARLRSL